MKKKDPGEIFSKTSARLWGQVNVGNAMRISAKIITRVCDVSKRNKPENIFWINLWGHLFIKS